MAPYRIPFVDLRVQTDQIRENVFQKWQQVLDDRQFIGGQFVDDCETGIAEVFGLPYAIGVGNGCDALEITLQALGVAEGDEVIIPSHTFIATALAVKNVGATPVVTDISSETRCLDPDKVRLALTERTKVVMPVHLYGQFSNCNEIYQVLEQHRSKAVIVEDSAQAQGINPYATELPERYVCTSFYPGKNLGAFGDAGAIITSDHDLADRARKIGNYGSKQKYLHDIEGRNSRIDPVQSAVVLEKIKHLQSWIEQRQVQANFYSSHLDSLPNLTTPQIDSSHNWHLYVVQTPKRDALQAFLHEAAIESVLHYPYSMGEHPLVQQWGTVSSNLAGRTLAETCLSLPLYPGLSEPEQSRVVELIHSFSQSN